MVHSIVVHLTINCILDSAKQAFFFPVPTSPCAILSTEDMLFESQPHSDLLACSVSSPQTTFSRLPCQPSSGFCQWEACMGRRHVQVCFGFLFAAPGSTRGSSRRRRAPTRVGVEVTAADAYGCWCSQTPEASAGSWLLESQSAAAAGGSVLADSGSIPFILW